MDKFRVGQKVRIIKSFIPDRIGQETTITSQRYHWPHTHYGDNAFTYDLDIKHDGRFNSVAYPEECLEPVYDGDQKSSWSESVWKPKSVSVQRKDARTNEQKSFERVI